MKSSLLIFCWLYAICHLSGYSQEEPYRFSHLTIDWGLSNNQVMDVLRDRK
ncbi:hypothetical protein [Fibrella aquatica]|uniref:hypothetical protein n=1 Tax=Fibrella aquatica TaxID=3242487 RepID=UPI0035223AF4